jgi:hypothetical protein
MKNKTSVGPELRGPSLATPYLLEQRFMFDGALPGTLDDQLHAADSKTLPSDPSTSTWSFTPLVDDPVQVRAVDPSLNNGRKEVAFIDTGVAGYQALVAGVRAGVEVVLLDAGQDG